jgi:uncharacterized membrane protein YedE/YeeE
MSSAPKFIILLFAGALFGGGLALSGMTDPARVIGFLDVAGDWDPRLMFVMAGALGTYGLGIAVARKKRSGLGWFGNRLPCADKHPINAGLIVGSALFGVGWGLSGFCPGPALANLSAAHSEALVFVPAMALGMLLAQRFFRADQV